MKRRTITSFISSKYRGATDKTYDLTVDYPDEGIACKENEYIELNVVSFDMPNNMYNINSLNNTLQVNGVNKYIQNGNYSVKTFKTILPTHIYDIYVFHNVSYKQASTLTICQRGSWGMQRGRSRRQKKKSQRKD